MSLAEALTAAAFLREDGQFIAVGDHRQMPPILQHAWDQASRRDLIIVSATVSDLAYAQSESNFLLEPRRLTVAVSRPKRKLIVLASHTVFSLIPADLDDYERGALWKHLRHECDTQILWTGEFGGYELRVLAVKAIPPA